MSHDAQALLLTAASLAAVVLLHVVAYVLH
jgi:hypothetical protein